MSHAALPRNGDRGSLEIRRSAGLPSIELHVGRSFGHSYPRHWHDEFFITAITGGEGVFRYRGTDHRATPGTLVLVVPGDVHSHSTGRGGRSFRSFHIATPLVSALAPELSRLAGPGGLRSTSITDPVLMRRCLALHRLLADGGDVLQKESRLLDFFVQLVRRVPAAPDLMPASGRENAAVRRAREFLDDACSEPVSLRDLASLAGLSPFHFHRVFRRQTGLPPHEYLVRRRILRARVLLGRGQPAALVAAETGFADQSHFTRHFKRLLGIPPAEYARQSKNVQDAIARPR
jgi:AraC-like DNA-binding protein